jgi:hypothetical protein
MAEVKTLEDARAELVDAAREHGEKKTDGSLKGLCEAATVYAKARVVAARPAGASALVMPFTKSKGKPLAEARTEDMEWALPKLEASVDDPEKARWRDANVELVKAIKAELAVR